MSCRSPSRSPHRTVERVCKNMLIEAAIPHQRLHRSFSRPTGTRYAPKIVHRPRLLLTTDVS